MASVVARTKGRRWFSESVKSLLSEGDFADPIEAMRAKSASLIERCEFDAPPIDHEMVASFRGIEKVEAVQMNEAGALVPIGQGRFVVFVNERDSKGRQRFSCFHEVSHTLFPSYLKNPVRKSDLHVGEYGVDVEEEYLCDVGAAELLMPSTFFKPALLEMGCSIETMIELARLYEASKEAVAVQMIQSAIHECAVIVWQPDYSPSQKKFENPAQGLLDGMDELAGISMELRIKFALTTPGMSHNFFPKGKSVEEGSTIHHCYLTGETCKGEAPIYTNKSLEHFYTESLYIPFVSADGLSEGKVITVVLPYRPLVVY